MALPSKMKQKTKSPKTIPFQPVYGSMNGSTLPSPSDSSAARQELLRRLKESGDWLAPPATQAQVPIEPDDIHRIRDASRFGGDLDQVMAQKLPELLKLHRTLGQAIRHLAASEKTNMAALTALVENSTADIMTLERIQLDRLRIFSREMPVFPHLLRIRSSAGLNPKNRLSDLQLGKSLKYSRELANAKQDQFTTKAHDYLWALHDHCHKEITLDLWDSIAIILRWYADNDPDLPALTEKIRGNRDEGSEPRNRARAKETIVERAGSLLGRHKSVDTRALYVKKRASRN
jgi:hypothetical protein